MDQTEDPSPASSAPKAKPAAASKPAPKPEPAAEMTDEEKQVVADKELAAAEKKKGNEAYKKKNFEEALGYYARCRELDPNNAVYLNNIAAVHLEKKEFDACRESCQEAIRLESGKQGYDYKLVAKSWMRVATSYEREGKLQEAVEAVQKSMLEDFTDAAKKAEKRLKAKIKKAADDAYLDPEKSEEAKARGNKHFTDGKWQEAIEEYTEALKRNPNNYKVYSNRAACYSKLMAWQQGLDDCEKCLSIEPSFVKAYIRKGKIQHFLKAYSQALDTFNKGLELDPRCTDLLQARALTINKINEENASGQVDPQRQQEAMKDPEIRAILADPMVQNVLRQAQEDPAKAQAAFNDPTIRAKLEKLIAAGVLQVGGPRG